MLISKFNKLIKSRILWGGLAVVIAFFFVGSSVMSRSGCANQDEFQRGVEGRLFGEDVSSETFFRARFFELGMRPMTDSTPKGEQGLRDRTWRRLAALHMADTLGLTVTDDEVRDAIVNDPTFSDNGVFVPQRYRLFVEQQLRINTQTFEAYVRQDIQLRKLMGALSSAVWTSPYELAPRLASITDSVAVEYAIVPKTNVEVPEPADDELQAYFDEHADDFTIPEQCRVRYVAYPVSNYVAAVTLSESEIVDYYENNSYQYTATDTNGTETTAALSEVREGIEVLLRQRKAVFEAKDAATDFVMSLAPDRYGQATALDDAAAQHSVSVLTSGWFAVDQAIPGIGGGMGVAQAAFELVPHDAERYFSDAMVAGDTVVVLTAFERNPPRPAEFEEVREQAAEAVRAERRDDMFDARLASIRTSLQEALDGTNTTFAAAARDFGLNVITTGVFSVYAGLPEDAPYGNFLIPAIMETDAGIVAEPVDTAEGAILAAIMQRSPGAPGEIEMVRPQFRQTIDQYGTRALFEEWSSYVLAQAALEDLRPVETDEPESM